MSALGANGMTNVLSTNLINGLSSQNVKQIMTDKINDMSFSQNSINLEQVNFNDKYKIDLSNNNFTITQTLLDGTQREVFKHDKNSNETTIPGFQGGFNTKQDRLFASSTGEKFNDPNAQVIKAKVLDSVCTHELEPKEVI